MSYASIRIKSIRIVPMVSEYPMPIRDNSINVAPDQKRFIEDTINKTGEVSFTGLNHEIGNIGGASLQPSRLAEIDGGWGTKRCRFVMLTETTQMDGTVIISHVIGYTDVLGLNNITNHSANFSPTMKFHINTIVDVKATKTPTGIQYQHLDTFNIITSNTGYNPTKFEEHLVRPTDIISDKIVGLSGYEESAPPIVTGDLNGSKQINKDPLRHLCDVANAISHGTASSVNSYSPYKSSLGEAEGLLTEPVVYNSPLIVILSELDNKVLNTPLSRSVFTYGDITVLNNGNLQRDNLFIDISKKPVLVNGIDVRNLTPLELTIPEIKIAYDLINMLNGPMWSIYTTLLNFTADNVNVLSNDFNNNTVPMVDIGSARSFVKGTNEVKSANLLKHHIGKNIMNRIAPHGVRVSLKATIDLVGYSYVLVSLDGRQSVKVGIPTVADATFTNQKTTVDLANDIKDLYGSIIDNIT